MNAMFKTWRSILLLFVFAPGLVAQTQQPPPANKEKSDARGTGTISGRVVNEAGQPLANALIYVRTVGVSGHPQTANTDSEGAFEISGLDPAAYSVSAHAPAYIPLAHDPRTGPPPTYRPGDSVTITLFKGGAVTGMVMNAAGEPVVAIGVRVQMIRDLNGRSLPRGASRETMTDDRGIYRVYGLMTGTYIVSAGGPTEFSNAFMNAFESDVATYAPSATRGTAAEINVRTGEEVSGIDIRYRAEPGRTVSGEVQGPTANSAFTVTLTAAGDVGAQWNTNVYQSSETSNFAFNGIADGDYDIYTRYYSQTEGSGVSEQKRISVKGADVSGIVLSARPFGSVAGRLVLEETTVAECTDKQRPLFNETMISAWHNENAAAKRTPAAAWSMGTPTPPNAEGNFVLQNLVAGEYFFAARTQAKHWYLRSVTLTPPAGTKAASKSVDATRVWTNVKPGEKVSGVTMTLAHGAALLRGSLVLGDGEQRPPRLVVYLVPAERERAEEVLRYFAAQVTEDGKFFFNNLAPGRYWIFAQAAGEGDGPSLTRIRFPHETALRARLRRDAEALKTEIDFQPCQAISDFKLPLKPPVQ
jgi:hypothetical protein